MNKQIFRKLFYMAVFLIAFVTNAQTGSVSGNVTDGTLPLPGVNISVQDTSNGVTSDFDGNFTLNNVNSGDTILFSYLGFKTQSILYIGQEVLNVVMSEDTAALDEVVIVGYGTSSKRESTSAITTIKGGDMVNTMASNPTTSLQGRMPGIQVESPGGQPGGAANVFIRGVNSLSNAAPLYVIDGLFVDNMTNINPKDISTISVLKDAAAASIYGSRAANGVVLIETNHGIRNQDMEVIVDSRIGFDTPSKKLNFITGSEYTDYLNQRFENEGESNRVTYNDIDTDWQKETLNTAVVQDLGVSLSGGNEKSSYYTSANYFYQDGILIGSGFKRLNFRANSKHYLNKFKITESIGFTESTLQQNNWYGWDGSTAPTVAKTNSANEGGFEAPSQDIHGPGGVNQYALATLENNSINTKTLFGNLKIDYNILDGLKLSLNLGADYINQRNFQFTPTYFMSENDAVINTNTENDLTDFRQEILNLLFEPTITYDATFGDVHEISAVGGYTLFQERQNSVGVYGQGTPSNSIQNIASLPATTQLRLLGENNEATLVSYFGRINYNYDDKYLLSATVRRDASSRFAEDNRSGIFPSYSAAWNVSNESFWNIDAIDFLKIRASYGELGSYPNTFYPSEAIFVVNQSNTSFGGVSANGLAQISLADPNLIWETSKTFDVGFDLTFSDNKFNLTMDYYSKDIEDVLVSINLPSTAGVSLPVIRNSGTLINQGLEFDLNYQKIDGDFTFQIGTNFSFNLKSEAGELPNRILGPGIDEDLRIVNRTTSGEPIGAFYGYKVEEKVNPITGDFVRIDTNDDGKITEDDITNIGDPTPDFTYGINFNGGYKNLDFSLAFTGVQGNEIYNLSRYYNILWQDGGKLTDVLDSWTPSNIDTSIPRATISDENGNKSPSSFFVEDGSYFRLKNIEVGYNLKGDLLGINWIKAIRISGNIQNAFVLTSYSGYDPDVASTNGGRANRNTGVPGVREDVNPLLGRGLDARAYPNARTYMFGLKLTF